MDQRLIDANKIEYENIYIYPTDDRNYKECVGKSAKIREADTVLTIPENPTNGDMIKAMFPNAEIFRREEYGYQYVFVTILDMGNSWKIRGEWWDAEYKGGN